MNIFHLTTIFIYPVEDSVLEGDIASASAFIMTALNTHYINIFAIFKRPLADINPRFILVGPSVAFVSRRKDR
jgi:hypothetical protein